MSDDHIFISYARADKAFVRQLREALQDHQHRVWVDFRNLRGGSKLDTEIEQAIESASHVIVVLSPDTVNSPWVRLTVPIR